MKSEFKTGEIIREFNRSTLRNKLIPMELVSGWPCLVVIGGKNCLQIPYYRRVKQKDCYLLYPVFCSATILVANPERLLDFTIYANQKEWSSISYARPVGRFKHIALNDVHTQEEYNALRARLYDYYDEMLEAVSKNEEFRNEDKMAELFTKLMEPSLYPFYRKINNKFYSNFVKYDKNN